MLDFYNFWFLSYTVRKLLCSPMLPSIEIYIARMFISLATDFEYNECSHSLASF